MIQRLIISSGGREITLADVTQEMRSENSESVAMGDNSGRDGEISLEEAVNEYEKGLVRYALEKYGSTRKAAKAMGVSQSQFMRKKKKYGM